MVPVGKGALALLLPDIGHLLAAWDRPVLRHEEVRAGPHEVAQSPVAVRPRVEVRLQLRQVTAERPEVRPSVLIAGLRQRIEEERLGNRLWLWFGSGDDRYLL